MDNFAAALFVHDDDVDWDLQAVVSGGGGGGRNMCFSSSVVIDIPVEEKVINFGFDNELEKLYKPFCPGLCNNISSNSIVDQEKKKKKTDIEQEEEQFDDVVAMADIPPSSTSCSSLNYKSRKNEKKRKVVIQVKAEGLSSDLWAWRKYGQKPIKGSPFPRSYYRCSSSKGWLARKQVERSCSDPDTFAITYTGDHCHSRPTRRSSLAGISRQKPSTCCYNFV